MFKAGFGITHGSRGVAIDGAKVSLTIDQRVAHGKILRHARHGIINCHISVRVVLAKNFANNTGGFFIRRYWRGCPYPCMA